MDNETPTPQDPSRFSKPKSEPVILDLEATEHTPVSEPPVSNDAAKSDHPQPVEDPETARTGHTGAGSLFKLSATLQPPVAGLIGGLLGGAITALVLLGASFLTDGTASKLAKLDQALATKTEQSETAKSDARLAALEIAVAEAKTALVANAKASTTIDPSLIKRIDNIEAAFKSVSGRVAVTAIPDDRRTLRLTLLLLLRDDVKADQPTDAALTALQSLGEQHPAFLSLKENLASPLPSYAGLVDEAMSEMKSSREQSEAKSGDVVSTSRFPSFLSQLITVRPAKTVEAASVDPDEIIEPVITALEDQRADDALSLIRALPDKMRSRFKALENDIARRSNVENAIAALLDDALKLILAGKAP